MKCSIKNSTRNLMILFMLLTGVPTFATENTSVPMPDAPPVSPCDEGVAHERLRSEIIEELRSPYVESSISLYQFHLTRIWPLPRVSDLLVYFEMIGPEKKRQAAVAYFHVDAGTCKPYFLKSQALVPNAALTPPMPSENDQCNKPEILNTIQAKAQKDLVMILSTVNPDVNLANFSFTKVWRIPGASDFVAYYEFQKSGLMTNSHVADFTVDPQTCVPKFERSTSLNR